MSQFLRKCFLDSDVLLLDMFILFLILFFYLICLLCTKPQGAHSLYVNTYLEINPILKQCRNVLIWLIRPVFIEE